MDPTLTPSFASSTIAPSISLSTIVPTFDPSTYTPSTTAPSTIAPSLVPSTVALISFTQTISPSFVPSLTPTKVSSSKKRKSLSAIVIGSVAFVSLGLLVGVGLLGYYFFWSPLSTTHNPASSGEVQLLRLRTQGYESTNV